MLRAQTKPLISYYARPDCCESWSDADVNTVFKNIQKAIGAASAA